MCDYFDLYALSETRYSIWFYGRKCWSCQLISIVMCVRAQQLHKQDAFTYSLQTNYNSTQPLETSRLVRTCLGW